MRNGAIIFWENIKNPLTKNMVSDIKIRNTFDSINYKIKE
jgi:hypothetical protein